MADAPDRGHPTAVSQSFTYNRGNRGPERLGAPLGPRPSSDSQQSTSSILRGPPQDPSSRVPPRTQGRSGERGALGGKPHGEGPQRRATRWTHRFAEVMRQVGPLRVVEDAVVFAFGATGLRHHMHHAILTGHLDRGWSQSRQGLAYGPAQLWMVPPSASAAGALSSGGHKGGQGQASSGRSAHQPWPCQGPSMWLQWLKGRSRATPHTHRAWAHPSPLASWSQRGPTGPQLCTQQFQDPSLCTTRRRDTDCIPQYPPRIFPRDNRQEPLCAGDRPTPTPECVVVGERGALTQQGVPRGRGPDSMPGTQTGSQKAGSSVNIGQGQLAVVQRGAGVPSWPCVLVYHLGLLGQVFGKAVFTGHGAPEKPGMQALPPALEGGKISVVLHLHLPLPSQPCSLYLRQD